MTSTQSSTRADYVRNLATTIIDSALNSDSSSAVAMLDELGLLRTEPLDGGFDEDGTLAWVVGTHNVTEAWDWLAANYAPDSVAPLRMDEGCRWYAQLRHVAADCPNDVHYSFSAAPVDGHHVPVVIWWIEAGSRNT